MGRVFAPLGRSRVGETVCHPGATSWSLGMSSPPQVEHLLCHFPEISILDQIWAGGLEKVLYLFLSSHYCIATLFWQRCFDLRNYLLQKNTSSTKGRQPCQYLGETNCHLITKCSGQWSTSLLLGIRRLRKANTLSRYVWSLLQKMFGLSSFAKHLLFINALLIQPRLAFRRCQCKKWCQNGKLFWESIEIWESN